MKDTLRLILFTDCNFHCSYCCNENQAVNSKFQRMRLSNINFSDYQNICITGGEPFLNLNLVLKVLKKIPVDKSVFIYSNGTLITDYALSFLKLFKNIRAFNIGLHHLNQIRHVNRHIEMHFPVRYMIQDIRLQEFIEAHPDRLNHHNTKTWVLDSCEMPNEDWFILETI